MNMSEAVNDFLCKADKGGVGASAEAIQAHYDIGNDFYQLWLDESMTYSCAIWEGENDSLEAAQDRKLDYHIRTAGAVGKANVLDLGCGWGSCLEKLVQKSDVKHAVGLTLSEAQARRVEERRLPRTEVRVESWSQHTPRRPYDAIISIAATAHFVTPEHTSQERLSIFRNFFEHCHDWLVPGGYMSVESIVYGKGGFTQHSPLARVFPESDMPRLHELAAGFDGLFEPESIVNHRQHYPPTLESWLCRLEKNRDLAIEIAGEDVVSAYEYYLKAGIKGHESAVFLLLRYVLRKL
jgi:cyclopropane-fatty-acyl-phospholipid synthase